MTVRTLFTIAALASVMSALPFTMTGPGAWVQPSLALADDDNEGGNRGERNRENGNRGNWNQGYNRGDCARNSNCGNTTQNQWRNREQQNQGWGRNGENRGNNWGGRDGDDDD